LPENRQHDFEALLNYILIIHIFPKLYSFFDYNVMFV